MQGNNSDFNTSPFIWAFIDYICTSYKQFWQYCTYITWTCQLELNQPQTNDIITGQLKYFLLNFCYWSGQGGRVGRPWVYVSHRHTKVTTIYRANINENRRRAEKNLQLKIQRNNQKWMGRRGRDTIQARPKPLGRQPTNVRIIIIADVLPKEPRIQATHQYSKPKGLAPGGGALIMFGFKG